MGLISSIYDPLTFVASNPSETIFKVGAPLKQNSVYS
jgi:hypothetical protein